MPAVVLTHDDVSVRRPRSAPAPASPARDGRRGAYIGSRALLREGLTVGTSTIVGMGAVSENGTARRGVGRRTRAAVR